MHYTGSCHCGRIAFAFDGAIERLVDCNCSLCRRRGSLLYFTDRAHFELLTPAADMSEYRFGAQTIAHVFCPVCGCAPLGFATDPSGREMVAVNVRCVDDFDLDSVDVHHFDGRRL
ncbi:GFA family protein [Plasticicumulans acidivorans]|uniref:CENP-V/GFA domain-containing protein n=1 Tax=Plasticicumulans acidivorans TaxID=886464 RepID=A0A317N034_9GAMM|nr:GFA family protein [Plasticicumulans acidivorans]PWV65922.1 hypothetical protein C7443_101408 [Plasticicumulans acidivorans]